VHFKLPGDQVNAFDAEPRSLLDVLLAPLREGVETSYSAPFATRAFDRASEPGADGRLVREFPRLQYSAAGRIDESSRNADVLKRAVAGTALGVACAVLLNWLLWGRRRHAARDPATRAAARTVLVLGALIGGIAFCAEGYHVFGTDKVGADVLYQSIKSVRTGILIGTLTTLVTLPLSLSLGIAAGYYRGVVDDVVQYLYTTLASIPGVLLVAASALMLDALMTRHAADFTSLIVRADLRLLALCAILGITSWTGLCRLLRGEALKLREAEYVQAAQALGVGSLRILWRHLLPNVMHLVIIATVLDFSGLVLAEAALTYIDIGVDPGMESWGNMINAARLELARQPAVWWSLLAAMGWMFVLVLAANLFADAVREAFDPRTRDTAEGAVSGRT
jgi:peptide/nickel transport system permease protein